MLRCSTVYLLQSIKNSVFMRSSKHSSGFESKYSRTTWKLPPQTLDWQHSSWTNHVTLGGVDSISQAFDGDPFDRHLWDPPLPVVVSVVDLLGEAEVGHAHVHVLIQPEGEKPKCYSTIVSGSRHTRQRLEVKNCASIFTLILYTSASTRQK